MTSDKVVTRFHDDDDGYLAWLEQHPSGFVSTSDKQKAMIHAVSCFYLTLKDPVLSYTANPKMCSQFGGELERWGKEAGLKVTRCSHCNPSWKPQLKNRWFGELPAYPPGSWFPDRATLAASGVHRPTMAGISGSEGDGADAIVLSGGYEDDIDLGDVIVYTGHGGNDLATGKQIADQTMTRQNLALVVSCQEGLPVRVTRGARHKSDLSPPTGYRYDGLYRVDAFWIEVGKSGFDICRFRLERISDDNALAPGHPLEAASVDAPEGVASPKRQMVAVQRIVRTSAVVQYVKALHDNHCQVCGMRLETGLRPYSEAAHIRPLGQPHNGPDVVSNILCLCPNDHVLFDLGGIVVSTAFAVISVPKNQVIAELRRHAAHPIDLQALVYHRSLFDHA